MFQQTNKSPPQMDKMDWLFNERDDLIVPQHREVTDRYLSLDYMFRWQESSNDASMFGELLGIDYCASNSETSLPRSGYNDWSEYQLDGSSSETEMMNDMLLGSFFEENSNLVEKAHHFVGTTPAQSNCSTSKPFNNLAKDLKCLEVPSVPLSIGRNKDSTPTFMLSSSEQPKYFPATKAPSYEMDTSPDADEQVDEETSTEAIALQELGSAMIKLNLGTRMNFRDAFYRLANNAKQHVRSQAQNGEFLEPSRSIEVERKESERNTFDSTVAHLMFNNLNCEVLNPSGVKVSNCNISVVVNTGCV